MHNGAKYLSKSVIDSDTDEIDNLIEQSRDLYISDPDQSKSLLDTAINKSREINYAPGLASAYRVMGNVQWVKGNYDTAMEYYRRAQRRFEKLDDKENLVMVYKAIGRTYSNLNDLGNSLRYFHLSLETAEEIGDKASIATCCNGLGFAYYHTSDYEMALQYFQRGLALNQSLGDDFGTAMSYNNIADICMKFNRIDQALDFAIKGLDLLKKIDKDKEGFACEFNITVADIYMKKDEHDSAKKYYDTALKTGLMIDYKEGVIISCSKLGNFYTVTNQLDKARDYLIKALDLARDTGNSKEEHHISRRLMALDKIHQSS